MKHNFLNLELINYNDKYFFIGNIVNRTDQPTTCFILKKFQGESPAEVVKSYLEAD
jgi:hypothetical protein